MGYWWMLFDLYFSQRQNKNPWKNFSGISFYIKYKDQLFSCFSSWFSGRSEDDALLLAKNIPVSFAHLYVYKRHPCGFELLFCTIRKKRHPASNKQHPAKFTTFASMNFIKNNLANAFTLANLFSGSIGVIHLITGCLLYTSRCV